MSTYLNLRPLRVCTDAACSSLQTVLIPQPTNLESDPLNWSTTKKHQVLFTVAFGALTADFVGAIGSAPMIYQSIEWNMSPNKTNQPNSITVLFL